VQPAAGRLISPQDDRRGCAPVAVLSYGFWQQHFGGAPSAMGSNIVLDRHNFQIIGVSARGFYGMDVGSSYDVAVPICTAELFNGPMLDHRSWWWLQVAGRAKPGVPDAQRKARLAALSPATFAATLPANWDAEGKDRFLANRFVTVPASRGVSMLRRRYEQPLDVLMAVVGLVLLIACANIASLMLARGAARGKEIAVRRALGASRLRLVRQLLTECILLSSGGALAGLLFARWGAALLVRYLSTANDKVFLDLTLDGRVLAFTTIVAVLTGVLSGALPAFRSTRVSLTSAMKSGQAGPGDGRAHFRASSWIVAAQVAMSLVLLVAAGLFLRSFVNLATLDLGFSRSNVLLVQANLQVAGVAPAERTGIYDQIESRLRALPGVTSASRSVIAPMSGSMWNSIVEVDSPYPPKGEAAVVYMNFVSPDYFATMQMPLVAGRIFDAHDTKTGPQVAVVSRTMAERFFPGQNPIGKYFRLPADAGKPVPPVQIVGLAPDSKYGWPREGTYALAFLPIAQLPDFDQSETFELRSALPPASMPAAVQDAVAAVNKSIPLQIHTLAERVDDTLVQERLLAVLSGFFGALALLLTTIGLYGSVSYAVGPRLAEFGIRRALGAYPRQILWLVMRDVAVILVVGVGAGVAISYAGVRLLEKLLFDLAPYDAITMAAAIGVLAAVAVLAGVLPARRAMRVDPMVALRYE
ncbi:MAG TPA: ABC transporter permease, partial [Candidatus Acidoferrales bacterium]|nr:ABC transporter permease [Candidatus Acidoferrales bacterium]